MTETEKIYALADMETENDFLGMKTFAEGCTEFIRHCQTPMSIAVQGSWGTGKSSFMRMIRDNLDNDTSEDLKCVTVLFNTWQYSRAGEERLFLPMLQLLIKEIDAAYEANDKTPDSEKETYSKYFGEGAGSLKDLLRKGFQWGLGGADAFFGGGKINVLIYAVKQISAALTQKDGGQAEDAETDYFAEMVKVKEKLQQRIDVLTGLKTIADLENPDPENDEKAEKKRTRRLVVFVDDLDRLQPAAAVSLLEDMKNFMDCEGCVFVLAMDHHLVRNGVKAKYNNEIDEEYARRFFEKIVQIPFFLPTSRYDLKRYVASLLNEMNGTHSVDSEACLRAIESLTDGNPRVIKRALNAFQMNQIINRDAMPPGSDERLLALLLLQSQYENEYAGLVELLAPEIPISESFEREMQRRMPALNKWAENLAGDAGRAVAYVLGLYESDPRWLRTDLFTSSVFDAGKIEAVHHDRDLVFDRICEYLEEKDMTGQDDPGTQNRIYSYGGRNVISVKKFDPNANINFETLKGDDADRVIRELINKKLLVPAEFRTPDDRPAYVIRQREQEPYIASGKQCLFIHGVTLTSPEMQLIIGDIVAKLLKEED
ncbi:MAG: hypothetical protein IJL95_01040 [Solobacterium sp.]|nr:hypothetical protein [Solobacterium sp.]